MFILFPEEQPEEVPPQPLEETAVPVPDQTTIRDQTTLVPNEAEAFALEPLDVTSLGMMHTLITEFCRFRFGPLVLDTIYIMGKINIWELMSSER